MLFVLIVIMFLNIKFFLFWLLCMTFTLISKHEMFRSIFNILAIATYKKTLAAKMIEAAEKHQLQEESLKLDLATSSMF